MAYNTVLVTAFGATLGNLAFGLRVVGAEGGRPGFGRALLRESLGRWASNLVFGLGYWSMLWSQQRCWHDRIAHTAVIRVR